jgi:fluoride exporter
VEAYLLGTGGAIGAVLRHLVYQLLADCDLPIPTLVVNVVGSFVFGLVVFGGAGSETFFFLGIGVCGAFTTFSTFSYETVRLWQEGRFALSLLNAAANALCSLAAMGIAWLVV